MTSKFRDIAAKHRERRMKVRRREMAFAASQANNNHHHHHRNSLAVPTGQVVSHVKDCNPHDVDVCSSISVSSYSDSTKDGVDEDDITNETFGETISESVEDEASSEQQQQQQPNNNNNNNKKPQIVVPTSVAKRHVAAYRRKGRSPMLAKKAAAVVPKINVPSTDDNPGKGQQQQKMTSPSWANIKLKKSSNINNSDNNVVMCSSSGDKNATTTDTAAANKVLTPRTRGSGGYSAGTAAGGSSLSNNNKQRVVRASTGSSRRRFKASYTYADRPAVIVQSPKTSCTPRTMMTTTQLRQTGSSFLKESSMSSPRNTTTPTAPLVAKKTSTTLEENDNDDFHEEKKEEHEKVVPETSAAPTSTTTTTVPPPAWSIKLKSTTGNKPSSSKRPNTTTAAAAVAAAAAAADADMTMMIQSTDDSQGQDDAQQQPIPPPLQTTSISTSTTASSSSTPPPAWSVKLKSTRAHAATATTANAKNDKKFKARVASTFQQPEKTSTFTTDVQSPQTSVSSKNQQQQQQVAGSKVTTTTTTHWAPAYAKRAAPVVTTTTTAGNTTFAALASPAAATQTTPKPVTLASPAEAWAQHKLKKTGFDVADNEKPADAEPPTGTENALVTEAAKKNDTRGDDSMQSPAEAAAGVVLSTLRDDDDDDKKPQPMSVPVWAQKKWNTTSLKQDEDQEQQTEKTSSSSLHPSTMKSNAPVAWALKKQKTNVVATKVEEQDPVVTTNTTTTTTVDDTTNQQRQSAPPPAWTLRKLKRSTIESEIIIIDQDRDKPAVAVPTPKTENATTMLTPKATSIDDGKNQRRSIRSTPPALWVQSNKARNAAENEHDQATHDGKETVVPTPRSSSMEQDLPPPQKTETSPLPQGANPLPVWAQISLKKTGIDVAEQHPLEKIITVDTKMPTLDKQQQQVVKESSTPKVQLSTNLTPKVERFGGSGGAWNPRVNLPPWAQTTLRNTANILYEDFLGDNDVQKAKGKPSVALTVIASENSAQIIVPRAAVDDVGDAAAAPLTQSLTSTSDADGEKFATTMAPWIRAKLKKKMGSDTTVEIWPEDECSNSFATNKSPAVAATTQTCNAEYRGAVAPPPSSTTAAAIFQVKLRKTGLYNKEIDPATAAPTSSTPVVDGSIAKMAPTPMSAKMALIADGSITKMAPTPMSAKMAPTPMSISSKMDSSKRQLTSPSWGKTDRRRDCADGTEAESCTSVPAVVVALEPGNEDQTTAPQPLWSTIKLRKTGIEVVEPTPGDERVMQEKSQAKTHPTVLTVSAAPERRTSSIREPTPRASTEETTPSAAAAAARAKTPDQSDSNNNRRSSPWPIAMLKKTGFDVTEQSPPPVDSTTDPVERVEENNAKEAVLVVGRVSVVVGSTPQNIMDRIDETEPVNNNNPWSMMKLKRTGFDVQEDETFSEPLLKTKDIISTVVEPIEVNRSATTAVVVEPEQDDSSDEPVAAEEGDTVRQQPFWAQLKLKKTGNLETTASAIIVTATPEVNNVAAAGKARHWKKARSNLV